MTSLGSCMVNIFILLSFTFLYVLLTAVVLYLHTTDLSFIAIYLFFKLLINCYLGISLSWGGIIFPKNFCPVLANVNPGLRLWSHMVILQSFKRYIAAAPAQDALC